MSTFHAAWIALCIGACAHGRSPEPGPAPSAEVATSGAEVGRLFDCFATLYGKRPDALWWVSPLQKVSGHFVATEFRYEPIRKYSGHEIMIFDRDGAAYYWMPGALPDAMGSVPEGVHVIDAELPRGGTSVRLGLEKRYPTGFVLQQQGPELAQVDGVQSLPPQQLDPVMFAGELRELAHRGLSFLVQALRSTALGSQAAGWLADGTVTAACQGLTPDLDSLVQRIEDELASGGP